LWASLLNGQFKNKLRVDGIALTSLGNRPFLEKIDKHGKEYVFPQSLEIKAQGNSFIKS
jgi:hypothetical protein